MFFCRRYLVPSIRRNLCKATGFDYIPHPPPRRHDAPRPARLESQTVGPIPEKNSVHVNFWCGAGLNFNRAALRRCTVLTWAISAWQRIVVKGVDMEVCDLEPQKNAVEGMVLKRKGNPQGSEISDDRNDKKSSLGTPNIECTIRDRAWPGFDRRAAWPWESDSMSIRLP